jgi:hypothetical protein
VEEIEITNQEYRGKGLGGWSIKQATELFGASSAFIMLIPCPLQFRRFWDFPDVEVRKEEIDLAFNKLRDYYASLGFGPLPQAKTIWINYFEL